MTISAVDLLRLVHPDRNSWICLGGIFRKWPKANGKDPEAGQFFSLPSGKRWKKGIPVFKWMKRSEVVKHLGPMKKLNHASHNIYYSLASYDGITEANKQGKQVHRRTKGHVSGLQAVWLDFDEVTPASIAFRQGRGFGNWPTPNVVIETSPGHCQCLWLLKELLRREDLPVLETLLSQETRRLGADPAAVDIARVFRLPGYGNANRDMFPVTAEQCHGRRYTLQDFPEVEKEVDRSSALESEAPFALPRCTHVAEDDPPVMLDMLDDEAERRFPGNGGYIGEGAAREARRRWAETFAKHKNKEMADWAVIHYFLSLDIRHAEIWKWVVKNRSGKYPNHLEKSLRNALELWVKEKDSCTTTSPSVAEERN